jgi:hypothetical protein
VANESKRATKLLSQTRNPHPCCCWRPGLCWSAGFCRHICSAGSLHDVLTCTGQCWKEARWHWEGSKEVRDAELRENGWDFWKSSGDISLNLLNCKHRWRSCTANLSFCVALGSSRLFVYRLLECLGPGGLMARLIIQGGSLWHYSQHAVMHSSSQLRVWYPLYRCSCSSMDFPLWCRSGVYHIGWASRLCPGAASHITALTTVSSSSPVFQFNVQEVSIYAKKPCTVDKLLPSTHISNDKHDYYHIWWNCM